MAYSDRSRPWKELPTHTRYMSIVVLGCAGCVLVAAALAVSARLLEWGGLIGG